MKSNISLSGVFSTARIYCLISIVSAHIYFPGSFFTTVFSRLGTVGVVGFLVLAGYFYKPQKFGSFYNLIKKKFTSIVLPWVVMGWITWLYNVLLNSNKRSVCEFVKWILGNGTFLYYMPILMLCFIAFYKCNIATLSLSIVLNIISIVLTALGYIGPIISDLGITNYLNVFNWFGFFAVGMLIQRFDEKNILSFLIKYRYLFIIVFIICFSVSLVFNDVNLDYFSYLAIPYETIGILAVFSVSTFVLTDKKFFGYLSSSSFTIYLIHMIFVGLLDGYLVKIKVVGLLSPLIIIALTFGIVLLGLYISRKLKLEKIYSLLTGVRIQLK